MARLLAAASSQSFDRAGALVAGPPFTASLWAKETTQLLGVVFWYGIGTATNHRFQLYLGAGSGNKLGCYAQDPSLSGQSVTPNATTAGVWAHCAGVWASSTSRTAYLDGVAGPTDTTTVAPGHNAVALGYNKGAAGFYFNGAIAEVGLWSAALTVEELAALAKGISPLLIRPAALVAYWPLSGTGAIERDYWRDRDDLTAAGTGTPAIADHPRILRPDGPYLPAGVVITPHPLAATLPIVVTLTAPTLRLAHPLATALTIPLTIGGSLSQDFSGPRLYMTIAGVPRAFGRADPHTGILIESVTITDVLNHQPNTCEFTAKGFLPVPGDPVVAALGDIDNPEKLFVGRITTVRHEQHTASGIVLYHCHAIDNTWLLDRRFVNARYVGLSATAVVTALATDYASDLFTHLHIQPDLPVIEEITFTNEPLTTAITRVAHLIGGYWYLDYDGDLHVFLSEDATPPDPLTPATPTFKTALSVQRAITQWISRVIVEGGGGRALTDLPPGETTIPVDTAEWYRENGGLVQVNTQQVRYTGRILGGGGSLVGPGIGPSSAPVIKAGTSGGSLEPGIRQVAVTFVTAAGESRPSPIATGGTVPNPTERPAFNGNGPNDTQTNRPPGHIIRYRYTWSFAPASTDTTAETLPSAISIDIRTEPSTSDPNKSSVIGLLIPKTGATAVTWIRVYSSMDGGPFYMTAAINATTLGGTGYYAWQDLGGTVAGGPQPPIASSAFANSLAWSNIPIGGAAVIARKLYATAANGADLKLRATLNDNTTTTYAHTLSDASLGALAPTADTSGLTQPNGQVAAGAPTIPVAGTGPFAAAGGWAMIGNGQQAIRYTGISGSTLTGIPPSGTGAIVAAISYNSTITAAPTLIGIPATGPGALIAPIIKGEDVNIVAVLEDETALADRAALFGDAGIQEERLQDRRLAFDECVARGRALLELYKAPAVTLAYLSRDRKTAAGKTVIANLPASGIAETLTIQSVRISQFHDRVDPLYQVEASTVRYSFEDLIRRMRSAAPGI